jgi:hypothetical protein
LDAHGDLFIADSGNNVVEEVTAAGRLSVVAGDGEEGTPTPGPATSSELDAPAGVAVDAQGSLLIADSGNYVVEEVTAAGRLSVVAGDGNQGPPTPGLATKSELGEPDGVAVDAHGDVFIADSGNNDVEKVTYALPAPPSPAVIHSVQAAPSALPAGGGKVTVTGRVKYATSCQTELLSHQSFPVVYSHNPKGCASGSYSAHIFIGANPTPVSRIVRFALVARNGSSSFTARFHVVLAASAPPTTTTTVPTTTTTTSPTTTTAISQAPLPAPGKASQTISFSAPATGAVNGSTLLTTTDY